MSSINFELNKINTIKVNNMSTLPGVNFWYLIGYIIVFYSKLKSILSCSRNTIGFNIDFLFEGGWHLDKFILYLI